MSVASLPFEIYITYISMLNLVLNRFGFIVEQKINQSVELEQKARTEKYIHTLL